MALRIVRLDLRSPLPPFRSSRVCISARLGAEVFIKCSKDGPSYAEIIGLARSKVDLVELSIQRLGRRRRGVFLSIPEADEFSRRLRSVFLEHEGKVLVRPIKKSDVRVLDVHSVTTDDVVIGS